MPPPDQSARTAAVDPRRSFIVQAPAGSGKTELLIQRYLTLLALVDEPEEVLAATFTLKAAGEMRHRVLEALRLAAAGTPPAEPHLLQSYRLASAVLATPARAAWALDRHPTRMRIRTLDAVNSWLSAAAPFASRNRGLRAVTATPERHYRAAARATLGLLAEDADYAVPVTGLLRHLDNDAARFEDLVSEMLANRDQWRRRLPRSAADRAAIEQGFARQLRLAVQAVADAMPAGALEALRRLLPPAAMRLPVEVNSPLRYWQGYTAWPDDLDQQLRLWAGLRVALLTDKGEWRSRLDKKLGFPPERSREKKDLLAVIADCQPLDDLRRSLHALRELPPATYSDEQWSVLMAMAQVLTLAAAELELQFAAQGVADFIDVADGALQALGDDEAPGELALALDYRLRHILVDEFQDTSRPQFRLLQRLVAGWTPGDGRSLFLVGDPMQSIYGFREAEVTLFEQVRLEGLGDLRPEFLQLTANFRAQPALVAWANASFAAIFPRQNDLALGSVTYSPSVAVRPAGTGGIRWHWLPLSDALAQVERVVETVAQLRARADPPRVCVLVRARQQAVPLMRALHERGIGFAAPEIAELFEVQATQELLALTRALQNPADRLAWIGVLRAAYVGLSLSAIESLLRDERDRAVPELLRTAAGAGQLTSEDQARVSRLLSALDRARAAYGRRPLRDVLEGWWLDLGGAECLAEAGPDRDAALAFLACLEALDDGGQCPDVLQLATELARGKASAGTGQPDVQLMTIHKAKGLEFDVVILPGLERGPARSPGRLLVWQELQAGRGPPLALLAPCQAADASLDPHYRFLSRLRGQREDYEAMRLLYVAATRARDELHLIAGAARRPAQNNGEDNAEAALVAPRARSLLAYLWPAAAREAAAALLPELPPRSAREPVWIPPRRRCLPPAWQRRACGPAMPGIATDDGLAAERPDYDWAGDVARETGIVVHRWLQLFAVQGELPQPDSLPALAATTRRWLEEAGLAPAAVETIVGRVGENLAAALVDPQARWLLATAHADAAVELGLTVWDGERFRDLKVDRTFIDAEGCRWIVDYKTTRHEGGALEAFLATEMERHRAQLERYRAAFTAMESRPVKLALYFPALRILRELPP